MPQGMSQQMRLPWSTGAGLELSPRRAESIVRRWQVRVLLHQLSLPVVAAQHWVEHAQCLRSAHICISGPA